MHRGWVVRLQQVVGSMCWSIERKGGALQFHRGGEGTPPYRGAGQEEGSDPDGVTVGGNERESDGKDIKPGSVELKLKERRCSGDANEKVNEKSQSGEGVPRESYHAEGPEPEGGAVEEAKQDHEGWLSAQRCAGVIMQEAGRGSCGRRSAGGV